MIIIIYLLEEGFAKMVVMGMMNMRTNVKLLMEMIMMMVMVFIFLVVTWGLYPGRHEHRPCEQDAWAIDQQEGPHLMIILYFLNLFCSPNQHQHHHSHHSLAHSHHGPTQLRWTCSRSPLSPHPTSDRRRRPPWRESRITFFFNWDFFKKYSFLS